MPEEVITHEVNFTDLFPRHWIDGEGRTSVLQSVYSCYFFNPGRLNPPYLSGLIGDVFYFVLNLSEGLTFQALTHQFNVVDDVPQLGIHIDRGTTATGTHIMFFTPYQEGGPVSEPEAFSKIESARGLVSALEGMNSCYGHVFTQILEIPSGTINASSPAILVPQSLPRPFIGGQRVNDVATALVGLDDSLKTRIQLALRWFDKADRDTDPIDSFLKSWFAIEVIGMPDTTNIRPLVEMLGVIYEMPYATAVTHFRVGRIADLRSDIVHNGAVRSIHQQLHRYVQAIFVDVLFHLTGIPTERRTEAVLQDVAFAHADWRP